MVDDGNAGALVTALLDLVRDGDADLVDVETPDLVELVEALRAVVADRVSVT